MSVPVEKTKHIKQNNVPKGYGMVRVLAKIGQTQWKTSVFYDSKRQCFLLPIKADIRRKSNIDDGSDIVVQIEILQ